MNPPSDPQLEASLVGLLMIHPKHVTECRDVVAVTDFYRPTLAATLDAIYTLHRQGQTVDFDTLTEQLAGVVQPAELISIQGAAAFNWRPVANQIRGLADRRRAITAANQLAEHANNVAIDIYQAVTDCQQHLGDVSTPTGAIPEGVAGVGEFLKSPEESSGRWVIPGVLRTGWRVLVVAQEGAGKSYLLRQIAICAAQGINPFTLEQVAAPRNTLIVDLENPDDAIREALGPLDRTASKSVDGYVADRCTIWRQPAGINLLNRRDVASLTAILERDRPEVVCLGPLYKAYRSDGRNHEEAANDVQHVLDDLRSRFEFALVMEHHARKADDMGRRDLSPYGSSYWLRWPELGVKMVGDKNSGNPPTTFELGRFKMNDRVRNTWPRYIRRGESWPWVGCEETSFAAASTSRPF